MAQRWRQLAEAAYRAGQRFHVALAGGSTPRALYQQLARQSDLPWEATELYFGDERYVSQTHPDSNYRMVKESLLEPLALQLAQTGSSQTAPIPVHPMVPTQATDAESDAAAYQQLLEARLPSEQGWGRFDLLLLGVGEDGHIASLFPDSAALAEEERWVVAARRQHSDEHPSRITLTLPMLLRAQHLLVLASGERKAAMVRLAVERPNPEQLPIQQLSARARLEWHIDRAAAHALAHTHLSRRAVTAL